MGVTKQCVSNWESQTSGLRESNLESVARYLGLALPALRLVWSRENRARKLAALARRLM